jgi:hypothetical protein
MLLIIPVGPGFNFPESKNRQLWVFEKNKKSKNHQFQLLQTTQGRTITRIDSFLGHLFDVFKELRTDSIFPKTTEYTFDFFITKDMNLKNRADTQQGFGAVSRYPPHDGPYPTLIHLTHCFE